MYVSPRLAHICAFAAFCSIFCSFFVVRLYLISVFFGTNALQGRSCRSRGLSAIPYGY
ncbi:hypothetical protein HMPREF3204_00918 [Gardnerella pickettii]|uniref:Uncharacterized protein n=1 Tax=Gardnerella pickettii JCP8017A TaxID=1261062 RepID=T2PK04_9BIFI|nr:hypothetical protein HMPREF1577_01011 [Gardnerella pickettii JCP8017A]EPI60100.1 hypothetical protein HMPREF1578_01181 [Gardnerella pickettii JCP8017B]KXA15847.1 hypothetical protein HMPREF3204_00918 [Gardnerella pickettii]